MFAPPRNWKVMCGSTSPASRPIPETPPPWSILRVRTEAGSAPPVTIQLPSEPAESTTAEGSPELGGLQGTWSHTLPSNSGEVRTLVLKYIKDEAGPERFEFVQHDWPDKPVFVEKITNDRETELRFKMVM